VPPQTAAVKRGNLLLLEAMGGGFTWGSALLRWLHVIAAIAWMRWGFKNEQFDEDIKYVVFNEDDKDKMTPEEFAKAREVMKSQMESRDRHLAEQAAQRQSSKA